MCTLFQTTVIKLLRQVGLVFIGKKLMYSQNRGDKYVERWLHNNLFEFKISYNWFSIVLENQNRKI